MNISLTIYCRNDGCTGWYRYRKSRTHYSPNYIYYECPDCGHLIMIREPKLEEDE